MTGPRPVDIDRGDGFGLTPAGFLYCGLCGALILEGYQEAHRQRCQDWSELKELTRQIFKPRV